MTFYSKVFAKSVCTVSILSAGLLNILPSAAIKPIAPQVYPSSGKLLNLVNGDLMCYVELVDTRGRKFNLGATFEVCQQTKLLNKRVRLTYKMISVNDCKSAEPCGRTKREKAIVTIRLFRK